MSAALRGLLVTATFLLHSVRAAAPAPDDTVTRLERARVCWAALDPECAEAELALLRDRLATLAPESRLEVLRLSAEIALAHERHDDARRHLLSLLELDPRFSPSAWPEPWKKALADATLAAPDRLPPELEVVVPTQAPPKRALKVEVRARDRSGIARCELIVARPEGELRTTLLSADGLVFEGEVPADLVRAPSVEVRVEAADRTGNLACWPSGPDCTRAAHAIPIVLPPPQETPPITSRWWFWTAVGAVAIGGAVTLVLALDGADGPGDSARVGDILVIEEYP